MVVHRTVLELHSKTELHRSAEQLKQLRRDLKQRNILINTIKYLQNQLLALPVSSEPVDVQTAVTGSL